jgi:DNA-binding transcriptional ArsR family regulator
MKGLRRERTMGQAGDEIMVVTDLATLRVVSESTRLTIIELLQERPRTVKELAEAIGAPQTRLYYHVKLLEEHEIIRVASTRTVSGIIEKTYAATASRISLDRSVLSAGSSIADDSVDALLSFVLDGAKAEIRRGVAAGRIDPAKKSTAEGGLTLGRVWYELTPARLDELLQRLDALYDEFGSREMREPAEPGAEHYEMVLGLYPIERREPGDA